MPTREHILILGMGASGRAAARLLLDEGAEVIAMEQNLSARAHPEAADLTRRGLRWLDPAAPLPPEPWACAVVSPGIPLDSPWQRELRRRGVRCLSELELGWSRRGRSRVLAITGSNGKSTAAKWCAEALALAGFSVAVGANYGTPVSDMVRAALENDWLVLEVSSFQLETVDQFRPDVGVLLNVHPNHLDRHPTMEAYLQAKARLFARMLPDDTAVVPAEWADTVRQSSGGRPRWVTFGGGVEGDAGYDRGWVRLGGQASADIRGTYYGNSVLGLNAAAVFSALGACGVESRIILESLRRLEPLPHRMQRVGEIGGVVFVDDSKATSLAAVAAALRMLDRPVRLIAGGRLKETDLNSMKELLAERVRTVYAIGESAERLASAWADAVPCLVARTMEVAVAAASGDAAWGEAVLLSPGCSSFDQYESYARRGEHFASLVRNLAGAPA